MLTADLVRVKRDGDRIAVKPLEGKQRERMRAIAGLYLDLATAHLGLSREDLEARCGEVDVSPQDRRVAEGLLKLVLDRCTFAQEEGPDPAALRREVFRRAAAMRRADEFDRETVLVESAAALNLAADDLDRLLFADLKGAQKLVEFDAVDVEGLLELYDRSLGQAVLLRAVRVEVRVRAGWPGAYRALFHRLKFLRLLYVVHPLPGDGGYRIEIDGPYSLFDQVTKYGLQLALLIPALEACGPWSLDAEVLWDKDRKRLRFSLEGAPAPVDRPKRAQRLPDDVAALVEAFRKLETPWEPSAARDVLNLPGVGVCVPDLVFVHRETRAKAYLEVLGYWSRAAVWRRVEMAERGLKQRVIWAVSDRLRVSEAALPPDLPGSLYVYKGVMNAKKILALLDR
jgi:predicted nuclease of restriction endonuclease-like RecB superfamily